MSRSTGFTYIGVLLTVAIMSAAFAATGQVWHTVLRREAEADLVFVGEQFKHALERYYAATPGAAKVFPRTLDELVLDKRHPVVVRHLRRIYADPITRKTEWGLVKHEDRIVGVYSLSDKTPFATRDVAGAGARARTYSEWRFLADLHATPMIQKNER